jgi:outer membrane protein OmpA-like peptidoglycan-associated protein
METMISLSADSLRTYNRWHGIVGLVLGALLLLLPWTLGIGPNSWRDCLPAEAPAGSAVRPASATPATPAPVTSSSAARLEPSPAAAAPIPTATVYFELDKADLPNDTNTALADVIAYLKAHGAAKALVSGFHDGQGQNVTHNQELALNRARAVSTALDRAGIAPNRLVLSKPPDTLGTGSNDEARRVDVTIQP